MPDWPNGVPFFTVMSEASGSGPQNAVLRSPVTYGPAKTRPLTTAAPMSFAGRTAKMTAAEFNTFEAWFKTDIGNGADSFTAMDPIRCVEKTFRFVGTYNFRRGGAFFFVSAELEILP